VADQEIWYALYPTASQRRYRPTTMTGCGKTLRRGSGRRTLFSGIGA
jgi:hypothetical protein